MSHDQIADPVNPIQTHLSQDQKCKKRSAITQPIL